MLIDEARFPKAFIKGFNNLADQIVLLQTNMTFKSLVVTSCSEKEGATCIAANLALVLSQYSTKKILLLESNFRKPNLQKMLSVELEYGLADVLTGQKEVADVLYQISPCFSFIPAGNTSLNPVSLLDSARMRQLMQEFTKKFDLIILDGPELSNYKDSLLLTTMADKTLLVLAENHTRRQVALKTLNSFGEWKGKILGIILNRRLYYLPGWVYQQI
jgi:capsular exopolysaccharide synthesis family protein